MSGDTVLVVAGTVLVALQAAKLVSTLFAVRWILGHGQEFTGLLQENESAFSEEVYWELLDRTGARAVPPFGVLKYRLHRSANRTRPLTRRTIRLARALLYDFTSLGLVSIAFLYLASAPMFARYTTGTVTDLAAASAALVVAQLATLYAEACVSYAKLGSYGVAFHRGSTYAELSKAGPYVTEIKTLAGAVIYSLVTGSFIFYFTAMHGGRFTALSPSGTTFKGTALDLLNCSYFSLTTFFSTDNPGPVTGPARAATAGLAAQSVCAVILAFSTFALYASGHRDLRASPARTAAPPAVPVVAEHRIPFWYGWPARHRGRVPRYSPACSSASRVPSRSGRRWPVAGAFAVPGGRPWPGTNGAFDAIDRSPSNE